jgi:hypothetical protein
MSNKARALRIADLSMYMIERHPGPADVFVSAAEELRKQHALIEELKGAIFRVLMHRHSTPTTGYLRDNDESRRALSELSSALAKAEAHQ